MKRSENRILTSHAGALPKPDDVSAMLARKGRNESYDPTALADRVRSSVKDVVTQQTACGLDVISDGEIGKSGFGTYVSERLSGVEYRGESATIRRPASRDWKRFPDYYKSRQNLRPQFACIDAVKYAGQAHIREDIETFNAAVRDVGVEEAFMSAISPGNLEHWIDNEHYPKEEDLLFALADALREEYQAIVDAGFILQIDNPDLLDGFGVQDTLTVPEFRRFMQIRVEALNRALRDIPPERVRMHACWGAFHGPHSEDIPLRDMIDLIVQCKVECISLEAANPRHEHEWKVFEGFKLPEGMMLMPGVVGHASDYVEHPELVAERLVNYAGLVGRENVIAGTDCGLSGGRVGHASVAWAKLRALTEGAALASKALWGQRR